MVRLASYITLGSTALLGACAGAQGPYGSVVAPTGDDAHWVADANPEISTLLVAPESLTLWETAGGAEVELALGAFYTRWDKDGSQIDQIALLFQLEADDAGSLADLSEALRLLVDDELYVGQPCEGANGRFLEDAGDRSRLSVAVPIAAEALQSLVSAESVHAQLGESPIFVLSSEARSRLTPLLRQVPRGERWRAQVAVSGST